MSPSVYFVPSGDGTSDRVYIPQAGIYRINVHGHILTSPPNKDLAFVLTVLDSASQVRVEDSIYFTTNTTTGNDWLAFRAAATLKFAAADYLIALVSYWTAPSAMVVFAGESYNHFDIEFLGA